VWEKPVDFVEGGGNSNVAEESVRKGTDLWEELFDSDSNRTYYYNSNTGETSWENENLKQLPIIEQQVDSSREMSDWITHYDQTSMKVYYENQLTGQTQWENPFVTTPVLEDFGESSHEFKIEASLDPVNDAAAAESFNLFDPSQHFSLPFSINPAEFTAQRTLHSDTFNNNNFSNSPSSSSSRNFHGYKSAPEEFAASSISLNDFNLASASSDSIHNNSHSKVTFHQSVSMEFDRNQQQHQSQNDINDEQAEEAFTRLKSINSSMDAIQATSVLISAIRDIQLLESSAMTFFLIKQLSYFSLEKYAEEHFHMDKRGDRAALERLLSHRSDTSYVFLHSRLHNSGVGKGFGSVTGELEACLRLLESFISDQPSQISSSELIQMLLQRIFNFVVPHHHINKDKASVKPTPSHHTHPPHLQQLFVDEIYAQLCKHTRNNPSKTSNELCWQLFLICLAVFPPSKHFLPTLLHHCLLSTSSTSFAVRAAKGCIQSIMNTSRRSLPTTVEIQSLLLGETCGVSVYTVDGSSRQFLVDSYTTISQLEDMVFAANNVDVGVEDADQDDERRAQKMRLRAMFGLFEVKTNQSIDEKNNDKNGNCIANASSNVECCVKCKQSDRVLDIVSMWTTAVNPNLIDAKYDVRGFLFKAQYHFPFRDIGLSLRFRDAESTGTFLGQEMHCVLQWLYWQAEHDVMHCVYPCFIQDAIILAAIQLCNRSNQVHFKNTNNNQPEDVDIHQLISPHFLRNKSPNDCKGLQLHVTTLCKQLQSTYHSTSNHSIVFPSLYLQYVSSWKLYGATFFQVQGDSNSDSSVVLAVSSRGLVVIEQLSTAFIAEYSYDQLISWGYSFDSFIFTARSKGTNVDNPSNVSKTKTQFQTKQGEEIDSLLKVYSKYRNKKPTIR